MGHATGGGSLCRFPHVQRRQHLRRRHRQAVEARAEGVVDGVPDRRQRRHERHLADPAHALRMLRVRHLDHDRVEHRQVRADGHAIIEEARIIHLAILVVDVFLVERPADTLGNAALHLALHIGGVDRAADILERRVAHDPHDTEFDIHLDIADVRGEAALGAGGVELRAGADRAAALVGPRGELGQRQRLELAGIVAGRARLAKSPTRREPGAADMGSNFSF